jgi:hypothetical protein
MAPIGLNLIATVQLFLLQTVRLSERLACSGDVATSALTCRRTIRRVLRSSDETFAIPDARSVAYRASGHTTSSHTYMNTSSINAIDNHGRDVVLLSVPNGAVSDAAAMEEQLRNLARSMSPGFVFERDDARNLWRFSAVVSLWWIAYFGLNRFRRQRSRIP